MSRLSVMKAGRAAASRVLFTDTCKITKPGEGEQVFDPETGQYVDPPPIVVYEGKCRIPVSRGGSTTNTAASGEQSFAVGEYPFEIPADAAGASDVHPNQTITYLTAPHNPSLVGRVFGVVDPDLESTPTRLKFKIKTAVG